jgi:hypothetical protein
MPVLRLASDVANVERVWTDVPLEHSREPSLTPHSLEKRGSMLTYVENMEGREKKSWEKGCADCAFSYVHTADPADPRGNDRAAEDQKS